MQEYEARLNYDTGGRGEVELRLGEAAAASRRGNRAAATRGRGNELRRLREGAENNCLGQRLQEGAEMNCLGQRQLRDGAETNCLGERRARTAANEERAEKLNPIKNAHLKPS